MLVLPFDAPFTPRIDPSALILVVGIAFSILLSLALWVKPYQTENTPASSWTYNPNRLLAMLLLVFGIMFLEHFLEVSGYFYYCSILIGWSEPLNFLIFPLLYFYIQCLCSQKPMRFHYKQLIHLVPFIVAFTLYLPWLTAGVIGNFVLFYAQFYLQDIKVAVSMQHTSLLSSVVVFDLSNFYPGLEHKMGSFLGVESVKFVKTWQAYLHVALIVTYGCGIFFCLKGHTTMIRGVFSSIDGRDLRWIKVFFVLVLVAGIIYCLQITTNLGLQFSNKQTFEFFVRGFAVIAVIYLGFNAIHQPQILSRTLNDAVDILVNTNKKQTQKDITEEKYSRSSLTQNSSALFKEEILQYMKNVKPYLDNELSLPSFAKQLDLSIHMLSQILNESIGQSFFDFINQYRVEHLKKAMLAPENINRTVLEMALNSGFNSKSAFYAAFKKELGMTPAQWRKKIMAIS